MRTRHLATCADRLSYTVCYSPDVRWYYLSEQRDDEALVFKIFDSSSTVDAPRKGIAPVAAHTGFLDDRYVGQDTPLRESIELRVLAVLPKAIAGASA